MKKQLFILLFSFLCICNAFAQKVIPKPNPARLVVDNASLLSPAEVETLERRLVALDDSTSNQITVVIVKTLNDQPIEDVAVNTFRDWGIGNKKTNNGVLLLIAVDDRKVRIEVGYGLEGAIPDITSSDIISKDIKPAFKQKDYYGGIVKATEDISKAASGEYHVQRASKSRGGGAGNIFKFVFIVFIVIIILASRGGRNGGGGGSGLMMLPFLMGGGGSSNWDSGSSGGGDFGGFGGGSSGGGGASGDW